MKMYVKASQDNKAKYFQELENLAYNRGYDLNVDDDLNISLSVTKTSRVSTMPTITVYKVENGEEVTYDFQIEFPQLSSDNCSYPSDVISYMSEWAGVGDIIEKLSQTVVYLPDLV